MLLLKLEYFFPTGFFFVLIYDKQIQTRKNIISIKISTLTCKFSNLAVIIHVEVYIVQLECIANTILHIIMIATCESGGCAII